MGGGGGGGGGKSEKARRSSARVRLWVARASTVLLWTCLVQLAAYRELWAPSVLSRWPGCLNQPHVARRPSERVADAGQTQAARALVVLPPKSKLVASWFMFFLIKLLFFHLSGISLFCPSPLRTFGVSRFSLLTAKRSSSPPNLPPQ